MIGGFLAVGHTYFEMLIYGTRRLFKWIFSFLDDYVVPKPPSDFDLPNSSGDYKVWEWGKGTLDNRPINPNPLSKDTLEKYDPPRYEYNYHPRYFNSDNSSWSLYNVLWYAGVTIAISGVLFLGYSLYPGSLAEWISPHNKNIPSSGSPSSGAEGCKSIKI